MEIPKVKRQIPVNIAGNLAKNKEGGTSAEFIFS
jgi:hypothetical protein